jgi:hypothetical protein
MEGFMPDSELVDYIQEQTQQGVTAENLRVSLMEAGWHEADISNALHDVAAGLHPTTPGASIHEDLAQVRGMVAHLATRVHSIEAMLASVGALGAQGQLPTGTLGPDRELAAPGHPHRILKVVTAVVAIAVFVLFGSYTSSLVSSHALSPLDAMIIAASLAALLLIGAIIAMRRHFAWTASLLTASAVTLWGMDVYVSWSVYQDMEWSVALALGVLLVVIVYAMGRWVARLSR